MSLGFIIANAFIISFAYAFITFQFMRPNRIAKLACILCIFGVELAFHFLYLKSPTFLITVSGLFHFILFIIISFFINANIKNILKTVDNTLSIILICTIYVQLLGSIIFFMLPNLFAMENIIYNTIMQVCVLIFAIFLGKYKNYFFTQVTNKKLLQFSLTFKIIFFISMNAIFPMLSIYTSMGILFIGMLLLSTIIIINLFFIKYTTKLILELEIENRKFTIALAERNVGAENVNKRYDEIIKFKHYCTKLYRSIVGYIDANDMPGLKKFYIENITPINDQLNKEIGEYQQVNHIQIELIKARMLELINTVSQLPNVNLYIHIDNIINKITMKDMDLFAILNIYIDNAVEETMTQDKGEILIQMTQKYDRFIFLIINSLKEYESTLKPENTHMGLKIIEKILEDYPNLRLRTSIEYGSYLQLLEVYNE